MTERDRVLDAFRNCITEPKCKDCPWTECETIGNGTIEIPRDLALAVMRELVAQEPRVMTLEEVAGYVALERETPIYMEFGYMATHAGQVMELNPKHMYFDDENGLSWRVREGSDYGKQDGVRLDEYNDIWRCWTSRPDKATREATPWNV